VSRKALHVSCFIPSNSNKQQQQVKVTTRARSSPPPELIKEEQSSLATARKAAGLSDDASPATDLSAPAVRQVLDTIKKGLDKQEEDLPKLEGAMLLAEQLFHASGGSGSRFAAAGAAEASPQSVDMWQVRTCSGGVAPALKLDLEPDCRVSRNTRPALPQQLTAPAVLSAPYLYLQPIFASAGGFPRLLYIPGKAGSVQQAQRVHCANASCSRRSGFSNSMQLV
jgi:hypothetical protein